jgi:hypothetical protein
MQKMYYFTGNCLMISLRALRHAAGFQVITETENDNVPASV